MRALISEKGDDPVLIIQTEFTHEAEVLANFERVLGPLKAEILHSPGYGAPYIEIRRDKS